MGVVYRGEDIKLGRSVALKFIGAGRAQDRHVLERFLREARTASSLNHPNICTIYEIEEFDGAPFIAMELLEGQTLDRKIDNRPLGISQLIDYALQICDALDAAHGRGILHRDIKPANIFVSAREQVKVLDFGLAKSTDMRAAASGTLRSDVQTELLAELVSTRAGVTLGTIAYMSPEQARGEELDARSDLFSFGLVLYEMTTGQRTFQGNTSAVVFDAILNHEPPAPIELNANIPVALERIIARLLEKDPVRRYQRAVDVRADLNQIKLERSATGSRSWPQAPASVQRSGAHWPSSHSGEVAARQGASRVAVGGVLIAALGLISFGAASWLYLQSRNRATQPESPAMVTDAAAPPATAPEPTALVAPASQASPAPVAAALPVASPVPPAPRRTAPSSPSPATSAAPAPAAATPPPSAAPKASDPLAELIRVARAKADAKLYDQAVADLRAGLAASPASPSAPAAHLLMASILQWQGRPEDAMAAYVELRSRHGHASEATEGTFLLADLILQSKRSDREEAARQLFSEIPSMTGSAPWAVQALMRRAALEERARLRVVDSTLGTTVPASLPSYRQVVESYPAAPAVEPSLARLAEMYEDLRRYDLAGQAWLDLARRFPGNSRDAAWRAGEVFEKRVKDPQRASESYALVPERSSHYRDAQKKLRP
jgi:serine/threonine protein kinase/outer membrane protein assembly factor BamD (BamD/ComL family)